MGIVGIPIVGYSVPDAFEKNLMIALLSECGAQPGTNPAAGGAQSGGASGAKRAAASQPAARGFHDLHTPLTNISGSINKLMQEAPLPDPAARKKLCTAIYDDTNWLMNMTENLLVATHLETDRESFKMRPERIEDLFRRAVAQLDRRAAEHCVSVHLEDAALMATMNARLIERVIINIMNNAIQYTPKGSHIELRGTKKGECRGNKGHG